MLLTEIQPAATTVANLVGPAYVLRDRELDRRSLVVIRNAAAIWAAKLCPIIGLYEAGSCQTDDQYGRQHLPSRPASTKVKRG